MGAYGTEIFARSPAGAANESVKYIEWKNQNIQVVPGVNQNVGYALYNPTVSMADFPLVAAKSASASLQSFGFHSDIAMKLDDKYGAPANAIDTLRFFFVASSNNSLDVIIDELYLFGSADGIVWAQEGGGLSPFTPPSVNTPAQLSLSVNLTAGLNFYRYVVYGRIKSNHSIAIAHSSLKFEVLP